MLSGIAQSTPACPMIKDLVLNELRTSIYIGSGLFVLIEDQTQ